MKPPAGSALFSAIVAMPFGHIGIRTAAGQVIELVYLPPHFEARPAQDAVAELAADQVTRYCRDPDFVFDLPLAPLGSAYQNKVWAAVRAIPRGSVRTYGELARHLGSAPRAIGQACGNNFFPLVIPCHRSRRPAAWAASPTATTITASCSASSAGCWHTKGRAATHGNRQHCSDRRVLRQPVAGGRPVEEYAGSLPARLAAVRALAGGDAAGRRPG